ncbi:FMN-binding protein [Fusobacterium ulcerans]|uniref:FMN-binding protein n=1 Tax=Fusobacterium ulcerans TaxID=861 RepID=UPI003FEF41B8
MLKKSIYTLLAGSLFLGMSFNLSAEAKVYQGLGKAANFRVGPGKDSKGVEVYSLNYVTASGLFDENGRIINIVVDALELSTPNYDGASMPHFSGWPGTAGYNVTDHESGNVTGISENTVENITAEVNGWKTKHERGKDYGMNPRNEWDKQMNFYQEFFKGKTVAEIEAWFAKSSSDVNGRPLKEKSKNEKDKEKFSKLSDSEKKELVDLVAGATMSIKDAHGDILGAIKNAYDNRVEVTLPASK